MSLEKKTVPSSLYIAASKTLTLPQVAEYAAATVEELYKEAQKFNLEVSGPCEFIYTNCTGEMDKEFELKIVIPIVEKGEKLDTFDYYESESYECISKDYTGSMDGIGGAWESLMKEVESNNIALSSQNHCREIYKNWLSFESPENITELQSQI